MTKTKSQILRDDPAFINMIQQRKEQTIGIYFYDYIEKGSCPRYIDNLDIRRNVNSIFKSTDLSHFYLFLVRSLKKQFIQEFILTS